MIRADDLRCGHNGREVLHGVSLHVRPGSMTGLLGPNGSGKTTLLLALAGAIPPNSGSVLLAGRDIAAMQGKERARRAASVPQKVGSVFPLQCGSVVLMGRYPHLTFLGIYSPDDRAEAEAAMARTGCLHLKHRPADAISGGELQRVIIARALAQGAPALLLDEPTANLDVAGTVAVLDLFKDAARHGAAVLMALHDLNLAALYCDELAFLKEGRLAYSGRTRDIFTEQTLSDVYETDIKVLAHPLTGAPQAHLVPGRSSAAGHDHGAGRGADS